MTNTVLRIDASARHTGSISRELTDKVLDRLRPDTVISRDLSDPLPHINDAWVTANFTPADQRDAAQKETLALSDTLVAELQAADTLVIGLPIYNFGVPAALKAWIDLVARAGVTFQYSEAGPKGLLTGKRAIVVVASGGTEMGSDADFATGHLRQVLNFVGISEVEFVRADGLAIDADATLQSARAQVDGLAA